MSWTFIQEIPWKEPLDVAKSFAWRDMALFYSGVQEKFTGGYSYLLHTPLETISGDKWEELPPLPAEGDGLPLWVGYLGYGMRETPARGSESPITLPDFRLVRYGRMLRFDHAKRVVAVFEVEGGLGIGDWGLGAGKKEDVRNDGATGGGTAMLPSLTATHDARLTASSTAPNPQSPIPNPSLASNLTREDYLAIVAATIARIQAGDFYQANITRKFFGTFDAPPDSLALFSRLCAASPAPYSAYIRHGGSAILSSSPECFLRVDAAGTITTRPIKGSARRSADEAADYKIREELQTSRKNHAENLMIVDLMRNDLARVSAPASVRVLEQSALYSYRTIHHLISTVQAQKLPSLNSYEVVRACFPAGSMTGAPKIAAMRWCEAKEKAERGVYSGAIGWFGAGGMCDLSVVIRTLILEDNRFEFQVGGGIVADSTPEGEWRETLAKARGILAALGVSEDAIAAL